MTPPWQSCLRRMKNHSRLDYSTTRRLWNPKNINIYIFGICCIWILKHLVSYQSRPRVDGLVWKSVTWQGSAHMCQPLDSECSLFLNSLQNFSCRAWQQLNHIKYGMRSIWALKMGTLHPSDSLSLAFRTCHNTQALSAHHIGHP